MDRFGPDNFSTLQIQGHVLHRARALKHFFDLRTVKEPSSETLLRLAELVLTLNCFSFADSYYKQINGVTMGTKMGFQSFYLTHTTNCHHCKDDVVAQVVISCGIFSTESIC